MKLCSKCNFNNQDPARYCQHCGALLETKRSLMDRIRNRKFRSEDKNVSAIPVTGLEFVKNQDRNTRSKVTQGHSLEDGSWFCPYCGQKNKVYQFTCSSCLEERP
nr:zinc ribbon domain-containing protein [uncultured Cellulosilyticum sp.]